MVILGNTLHACLKSLSIIHTNCTTGSKSVYMCSELVIGVYYMSIFVNYEIYFALIVMYVVNFICILIMNCMCISIYKVY